MDKSLGVSGWLVSDFIYYFDKQIFRKPIAENEAVKFCVFVLSMTTVHSYFAGSSFEC